jgi:hypothetical protein
VIFMVRGDVTTRERRIGSAHQGDLRNPVFEGDKERAEPRPSVAAPTKLPATVENGSSRDPGRIPREGESTWVEGRLVRVARRTLGWLPPSYRCRGISVAVWRGRGWHGRGTLARGWRTARNNAYRSRKRFGSRRKVRRDRGRAQVRA